MKTKVIRILELRFIITVVVVEFLIMLGFHRSPIEGTYLEAFLDAFILGFTIFLLVRYTFHQPLKKIFDALEKFAEGNLDITLDIRRPYEMRIIAGEVNKAVEGVKKYYAQTRESAELLRGITDGVDEAIMLIDKDFKILWANRKVRELGHLTSGDVLGQYCYKVTHHIDTPCQAPKDVCPIDEIIKQGKQVTVLHTHYDKEGNPFYVDVTAYPIKNEKGEVTSFIHMARNVTERIKLIEELRLAKEKIEEYSHTLEETVEERTASLKNSMEESEKQRVAILNILEDADEARRQLIKLNDELRQTQAQLVQSAKMAAVGQLASGVAHEINNPLTGVLNNLQLIKMEAAEKKEFGMAEFKELLDIIEDSALRCKKITRSLLDFSHSSREKAQMVSLNELIEKVVTLIGHEMKLENITIDSRLDPEAYSVIGDSQLLQQVIFNIVTNAKWALEKKFKREGGLITIITRNSPENKRVCIDISDNGVGIPKENLEKIFEPFFTTKPVGEGTGLGLSVVYSIVKEHKGRIEVESTVGEGTTFKICFPGAE